MKIILASHNRDKLLEFREILPQDIELSAPPQELCSAIEENGASYKENALIKARAIWELSGGYVLADDSGLSVDLLDGYPGIYSARFAGEDASYKDKIAKLWSLLEAYPKKDWTAAFICALALIDPEGEEHIFEAELRGLIWPERRGKNGFGYDPIFYVPQFKKTTAELRAAEKHGISHRGRAASKLIAYLYKAGLLEAERGK